MEGDQHENFFTELLKFAFLAIIIVVPVRLFVAQPFIVSGQSMEPTFDSGQYLIIDELSYHLGNPSRGDIIIFQAPKEPRGTYYIKRIIGLPGETVEVRSDSITIVEQDGSRETLSEPYLTNHGNGPSETVSLGAGEYFAMGDNRPNSSDSRAWGPVPRGNIVGRVFMRLLPMSAFDILPGSFSFAPLPSTAGASSSQS